MTIWKLAVMAIVLLLGWLALVFFGAFGGWWMSAAVADEDTDGFFAYAVGVLEERNKGASALVLISDGKIEKQHYASPSHSIDADTVFAAASMSKWFAAHTMMTLVDAGHADLDAPVSQYLTRWQLPDSAFNADGVTIRRLLSHTAGLNDNLGFGEYSLQEPLPSVEEELSNPRASSGEPVSMAITTEPGSEWSYSGGSYLLLELLIEEISGQTYEDYVSNAVFTPLDMARASYEVLDTVANNAGLYEVDGSMIASPRYASSAATGLVISSADLAKFVLSQIALDGTAAPVRPEIQRAMRAPHGRTLGADIWGLGTILYAPTSNGDFIFGHDGANDPAVNAAARINPDTGDAIIVLASGHPSVATNVGSEWVLWQTGVPDVLATDAVFASMAVPAVIGCVLILVLIVIIGRRSRTRRQMPPIQSQANAGVP